MDHTARQHFCLSEITVRLVHLCQIKFDGTVGQMDDDWFFFLDGCQKLVSNNNIVLWLKTNRMKQKNLKI